MVTEQEARDMFDAIEAFQLVDQQATMEQNTANLAVEQAWYDTTIKPTLLWNDTQTLRDQFNNTLIDRDTLKQIVTSNRVRKSVISKEVKLMSKKIESIKVGM